MAKGIVVTYAGTETSFAIERLERAKLYGYRRRIAIDADGRPCTRAALTEDGQVLLRSGMAAQGYFDPDGRQVETSALTAIDAAGNALSLSPSTLGVAQALEGPVDPREVLDLAISSVYRLVPEGIALGLAEGLSAGHVFRAPFNYRPDYQSEIAYLVQNDAGIFALVGVPAPPPWLSPDAPPPADDTVADEAELDFEMF
jgi:hypothetical protein